MINPEKDYPHIKNKLQETSSSFCLAKWLQVSLHLQTGGTHSCHLNPRHRIPSEKLETNPSGLHNTETNQLHRQQMLDGIRPKDCSYCWDIEDTPGNHWSDRIIKSSDTWARPSLEKIISLKGNQNLDPTYL